jgi:spermidine synthase
LNLTVAAVALLLANVAPFTATASPQPASAVAASAGGNRTVYVAIALSGMTALGAEVIWTRILSLLFGATVYTFSLILAVFLLGLGIGSSLGSGIAGRVARPRLALGWCQMLLCVAMAWTAYMLTQSLPYWPINPSISSDPWYNFQLDFVRCLWAVLPGAILWGASFPLALASVATGGKDPARLVGGVYAANTLGAIVGSVTASLLLVVWLGSQRAQQVLVIISAVSALLMLESAAADAEARKTRFQFAGTLLLAAAMGGAVLLARTIHTIPGVLVAYGRYAATRLGEGDIIYVGEGWNASVAVSRLSNGVLNYHNAGKVQASSEPQDMRLQRMLGHMTTLIPKNPESVLVIGCGAGVTAGAVSVDPNVKRLTIAEIEPLVPRVVSRYFAQHNFDVVANPKTHIELDDARHYLLTTKNKFDAITSDPLDPWVKGAAMLYTKEFFETVKAHLNPGGAVTLFVQLYESNTAAVKSEIATFLDVFPGGVVWGNTNNGAGYDLVLLGQAEPTKIDVEAVQRHLSEPSMAPVAHSLGEIGMFSAIDLFSNYAGTKSDLAPWLADAVINRDRNLRLQYLAGMGFNLYQSEAIYADMLQYSQWPNDLFIGSDATKEQLRSAILRMQGK